MLLTNPDTRPRAATFALATLLFAGAACGGEPAVEPPVAVVTDGLSTPESVLWDASRNVWYVSNINGGPTAKDDNGYIVRLTADGALMDSLPFINGADDDITLHAPKGMAKVGDTLWVADIDALRAFNLNTGTVVTTLDLSPQGATFLNDIAASADGTLYITDSGIGFDDAGNVSHPGQSRVIELRGRSARPVLTMPAQTAPNGIAWDGQRNAWVIVAFNAPDIFVWTPGASEAVSVGRGAGGGDGVVALADGRILFSSWADSSLSILTDSTVTRLRGGLNAPADIGYDPGRRWLGVPLFLDNRVEFHVIQ